MDFSPQISIVSSIGLRRPHNLVSWVLILEFTMPSAISSRMASPSPRVAWTGGATLLTKGSLRWKPKATSSGWVNSILATPLPSESQCRCPTKRSNSLLTAVAFPHQNSWKPNSKPRSTRNYHLIPNARKDLKTQTEIRKLKKMFICVDLSLIHI